MVDSRSTRLQESEVGVSDLSMTRSIFKVLQSGVSGNKSLIEV